MNFGDNRKLAGSGSHTKRFAVWMWVLLFALVGPAFQQIHAQASAGLTGTVTDPAGAAISGAKVTFKNEATGVTAQFATSSQGVYTAPLGVGAYDITVQAPGFQRYVATHVVVEVGAMPTFNIKLSIGAETQTVQVASGNSISLNTTSPQLDTMLPAQEVSDLPLEINGNMRQINSFATLAPGVRTGKYGSVTIEGGSPNQINSAGAYYNGLQLDTASAINSNPPYEMVDEFRVVRNTFSARYGMVQGAISYNMRSGTNKLHGDGFMIDRNESFDSAGFFPTRFNSDGSAKAPIDKETDWGGTIGGPVVIPHLYDGHNKTFFLGSFDKFDKSEGVTLAATVPTVEERNGDFTHFYDSKGNLIPIYDPQTGQQFQCNGVLNVICQSRFDPLSKSLLQYIPTPNTTGTNYGLQGNMNPVIPSVPFQTRAWGVTINHQLSDSQSLAFTWWHNHYYVVQEESTKNGTGCCDSTSAYLPNNPLSPEQSGVDNTNVWLANYTKTLTPNLVMTAGFAAEDKMQNYVVDNTKVNFAGVVGSNTMPFISFDGQNPISGFGNANGARKQNYVDNIGWNMFDNFLWTKGRHTFNIGMEYRNYTVSSIDDSSSGHFYFSQAQTSVPNTKDPNFAKYGSSFASFLLGDVAQANRSSRNEYGFVTHAVSGYLQDDIKLTSKFTLNAGVRWDLMMPYTMTKNNDVFLDPSAQNPAAGNLPGAATEFGNCSTCAGVNRAAIHWKNFGPHVGFAYSIDNKTVVQAGYFINYLGFNSAYGQGEGEGAPGAMVGLLGGSFTVNGTGSYVPGYGPWTDPSTGAANPIPSVSPTPYSPGLGVAQTINYFDLKGNGKAPHMQAYNASVQRQMPWSTLLTVAYSVVKTDHLTGYNINPISQPDSSVLQYGDCLTYKVTDPKVATSPCAGITAPYTNFASQFGGGATVWQALKNFPQYSNVARVLDQAGTTYYSALQIQADKHMSNNLNFLASITLPRDYDNLTTSVDKANQKQIWAEDSMGSFESKIAATYALPFGKGQRWLNTGHAASYFAGGWQVSAILTYNNAQPLAITQSGEKLMNGTNYPNFVSNVPLWSGNYDKIKQYFKGEGPAPLLFNKNAWVSTGSQYVLGNAQRAYNQVRGPWYPAENLSARKQFHITEGSTFTLRMDYFNAFNRTQVPFPSTDINSSNFGYVTNKFAGGNRQGQIEGTINF